MTDKRKIVSAFLLSIAVLVLIGFYSYRTTYEYKNAADWVNHTEQVIAQAQAIVSDVQDIETAQRGYVITGENKYQEAYKSGLTRVNASYDSLRNMVLDDPARGPLLDSIQKTIATKVEFAQTTMDARQTMGFEAARGFVATGVGENLGRKIKAEINLFVKLENELLTTRLSRASSNYRAALILIIISILSGIIIVLSALYFFLLDYNKRIESEKRVRESEALTKNFLRDMPVGVFILDKNGDAYYNNDKAKEVLGKGVLPDISADMLNSTYSVYQAGTNTLYPTDKLPIIRALKGERGVIVEDLEIVRGDTRTLLRVNSSAVTNLEGNIEYAISVFEDISVLKKAELKIKESEEKFNKAFSVSPVAFAISDTVTGRYIEVNESFVKMSGYSREELLGRTSVEVGLNIDPEMRQKILKIVLEKGYIRNVEQTIRNKAGKPIEILSSVESMEINGRRCSLSINYDITELKDAQRKLQEANVLAQQSVLLKEAFLANMSHEIRTPMNAIIGFTDLLLKRKLGSTEADYIKTIKASGENLLRIINDILDLSKIESGMMAFEEHPVSIKDIFSSLRNMLLHKAVEKRLLLNFECDNNVPEGLAGDPMRLTQIILNLVGNAIKFTERGGVSMHARLLAEEKGTYTLEFVIKDTGIGIPEEKLNYIFERFRQAEAHTTRNYGGTGLGLSIARQLIELQHGTIKVESKVGSGSVFTFTLPFKKTTRPQKGNKENGKSYINPVAMGKLYVLVAEDNPVNVKFVKSLFLEYKIKTDVAENGKKAVEMVRNNTYDLVLMDIEMPEMNGYEATAAIRSELKSEIPIFAMTAHAMAGEKDRCIQLGMNDYISKPIRSDVLFEKMFNIATAKTENKPLAGMKKKLLNLDFLVRSLDGDRTLISETIDVFIEQMPEDLAAINDAVTKADYLAIKGFAHRMKSTVTLLGAADVEALLEQIETTALQEGEMETIVALHKDVVALCIDVMQEIATEKVAYSN